MLVLRFEFLKFRNVENLNFHPHVAFLILQLAAAIQQEKERHERELRALEQRLKESFVMVSETKL